MVHPDFEDEDAKNRSGKLNNAKCELHTKTLLLLFI